MSAPGPATPGPARGVPSRESSRRMLELRVDTTQILLACAVLAALAVAWFLFDNPEPPAGVPAVGGEKAAPVTGNEDVTENLTFFDRLSSGNRNPAATPRAGTSPAYEADSTGHGGSDADLHGSPTRARTEPAQPAQGAYAVQVFAGDRKTAEGIRQRLADRGFPASVLTEGTLVKVRVGGYPDRTRAEAAALRLAEEENLKTWIVAPR